MNRPIARIVLAVRAITWSDALRAMTAYEEEDLALVYGEKSYVTIATGSPLPLRRAPSVAAMIPSEDIKAMRAIDPDEVLETVQGAHVSRFGLFSTSTCQIRGINGNPANPAAGHPEIPTSLIPGDLPVVPRSLYVQAEYKL